MESGRPSRAVLTAASPFFERSVLALVGSVRLNWPGHPPIIVYDLGMDAAVTARLRDAAVDVRPVPPFCPHWRQHFTWRFWCLKDAPARAYLWLDAGTCVLRPLDEVFTAIERMGYFCSTNHWPLRPTTTSAQETLFSFGDDWLRQTASINAGVHGLLKEGAGARLIERGFSLCLNEQNLRASAPLHRHDQPLLTMLLYEHFGALLYGDFLTYAGWQSPQSVVQQKVWVHRGQMRREDLDHFAAHLSGGAEPYLPSPLPPEPWLFRLRKTIARARGRGPRPAKEIPDGDRH
jgi:hypothetical protein